MEDSDWPGSNPDEQKRIDSVHMLIFLIYMLGIIKESEYSNLVWLDDNTEDFAARIYWRDK